MTPADELRAAAATIRRRAERAQQGEWEANECADDTCCDPTPVFLKDDFYTDVVDGMAVLHDDAVHIATWSPPVALAVAGMLDEALPYAALRDPESYPVVVAALVLARLINGTTA